LIVQVRNYLFFIYFFIFIVIYDVLSLLKQYEDKESFDSILFLLLTSIKDKAEEYNKQDTFYNDYLLQNYLIVFMILTVNLDKYTEFMKSIFRCEFDFFHNLIDILDPLKESIKFLEIIDNLFFDGYKQCFFYEEPDVELEELLTTEQIAFFQRFCIEQSRCKKADYINLFSKLKTFDLSYDTFFENNKDKIDEKKVYKLAIAQSLIRVIFLRDKQKYINEPFYEFNLIKTIIDKDMEETIQQYGNDYKTLFRKEDICDDFLKYMVFVFGNKTIIESFINPLTELLNKIEPKDRNIHKDEFDDLVTVFLSKLGDYLPNVLRILLKILYESIRSHFTIEVDNYSPLYTTLIFNFIISPRIQAIYNINSLNPNLIRSLNRLLRNTCFNFKFPEKDPLNEFNDLIEKNNLKIKKFIKENIIEINIDDDRIKSSLGNIFVENFVIYPQFLFNSDKDILWECMKREPDDDIKDKEP
jgi:hypothetical protein